MTKHLKKDIDRIVHVLCMRVCDSRICLASNLYSPHVEGKAVDYWVSHQKEKWPGNDIDNSHANRLWPEMEKEHHDRVKSEGIGHSRWLREHGRPPTELFNPLNHAQAPFRPSTCRE